MLAFSSRQHAGVRAYAVRAADGSVEAEVVPALGAVVSSLRLPAVNALRECLFQHAYFWEPTTERTRGGIPFLFPVCGRLERDGVAGCYLYEGTRYTLPIHGFGMRLPWEVVRHEAAVLTVALRDSDLTRAQYPFAFEIMLTFRAVAGQLLIEQEYRNPGTAALPYYAGFHPYFLTPPAGQGKEAVQIRFQGVARFHYNTRLTDVVGRSAPPSLPASIADPELHECLCELAPGGEVRLDYPDGMALHLQAAGAQDPGLFRFLQLYTIPEEPFFCAEPWMGFPNALNTIAGCRWLAPGHTEQGVLRIWTSRRGGAEGEP